MVNEQDNMYALNQRKALRQLIKNGKIEDAFDKLRDWYPQIVQDDASATCFLLHCQKFIELVRAGRVEEAVAYGRMKFDKFYRLKEYEVLVKIIKNRETGKSKGFGFVKFKDEQAMRDAIEGMHGQHLAGRNITVTEAKTRGSGGGVGLRSHGGGSNRGRGGYRGGGGGAGRDGGGYRGGGGGAGRDGGGYGGGPDRGYSEGSGGHYSRGGGGSDVTWV
ncbi:hypothetical protein CsSME_00015500 [Camellia sinensis var. sinensis]